MTKVEVPVGLLERKPLHYPLALPNTVCVCVCVCVCVYKMGWEEAEVH